MRGVELDSFSPTGRQIYRQILRAGHDLRWFAKVKGWVTDKSDGSDRVSRYVRKGHNTRELLDDAELLGCSAADLLPPEFFEPPYPNTMDRERSGK